MLYRGDEILVTVNSTVSKFNLPQPAPLTSFNSANYQGMLDLPDTDPQVQSELVPVESYPESDMALLIHACAWIYANSINIDSVTHSPIRMSVVEHLVNILSSNCCLPYGFERT